MKLITMESLRGQSLALVPLAVGVIFGGLMLPRSIPPEEVPTPTIDARLLAATVSADDARAKRVSKAPLSSHVRAVGSGFRAFNDAEAHHADEATISRARDALVRALRETTDADVEGLKDLRAYQLSEFLAEVGRFERSPDGSPELAQLGGTFIERMEKVGWCVKHHVLLPEDALRVAFKSTWNHALGVDASPAFALTLDEYRALYSFYFTHPHPAESDRVRIETAFEQTPGPTAVERATIATDKATSTWLMTKIGELAKLDPTYPVDLARGSALFLRRDYRGAAATYQDWLEHHPSGLWTLRVQNYMRAAAVAAEKDMQ